MLSFIKETNKIISLKKFTEEKKLQKIIFKFAVIAAIDHKRRRNIPNFVKHSKSRVQSYEQRQIKILNRGFITTYSIKLY